MAMTVRHLSKEEIKNLNMNGVKFLGRSMLIGGSIETNSNGERILRWALDDEDLAMVNGYQIAKMFFEVFKTEIDGVLLNNSSIVRREA